MEHHPGKETRVIPLFGELRPILTEAFEAAPDGAEYVVGGGYREVANTPGGWKNCNLRTQFLRLIRRAGLVAWQRPFHALRGSRETELAKEYPLHVVTSWMGNTATIAMRHYLMTTDADFERAAKSAAAGAGNGVHQREIVQSDDDENAGFCGVCAALPSLAQVSSGGHGTRTHNRFPGTTFPVTTASVHCRPRCSSCRGNR
jgi:hypothetical protein